MQLTCFKCQKVNSISDKVHFRDECEFCGQDLHACKQCQNYDEASYNECKDSAADRILDKEKSNYCDFYIAKADGSASSSNASAPSKADLLAQAEALFKKK